MNRGSDTTNTDPVLDSLSDSDSDDSASSTKVNVVERNDLESVDEAIENNVHENEEMFSLAEMYALDDDWNRQMRDYIDERVANRPTPRIPLYLRKSTLVPDVPVTSTETVTPTTTIESQPKRPARRTFISIPASSKVVNWNPTPKVTRTLSPLITINDMKSALEPFQPNYPETCTAGKATTVVKQTNTAPKITPSEQSSSCLSRKQADIPKTVPSRQSSTHSVEENKSLEPKKPEEKRDLTAEINALEEIVAKIFKTKEIKKCVEKVKQNKNFIPIVPLESLQQVDPHEVHEWSIPTAPKEYVEPSTSKESLGPSASKESLGPSTSKKSLEPSAPKESLEKSAPKKYLGTCLQYECSGSCVPYERLVPVVRKECLESSVPNEPFEWYKRTTCFSDSEAETVIENKSIKRSPKN